MKFKQIAKSLLLVVSLGLSAAVFAGHDYYISIKNGGVKPIVLIGTGTQCTYDMKPAAWGGDKLSIEPGKTLVLYWRTNGSGIGCDGSSAGRSAKIWFNVGTPDKNSKLKVVGNISLISQNSEFNSRSSEFYSPKGITIMTQYDDNNGNDHATLSIP